MAKIVTQEEIISRFKKVHGDRYDYSLVDYVRAKVKVKIICHEHGVFEQTPDNHKRGYGCPKCGTIRTSKHNSFSIDDFIKKANKKHNYKYDYSESVYIDSESNIRINCKKHGYFFQQANSHLCGRGCPKCSGRGMTTEDIIEKFKSVHGDKYDYSLVDYVNAKTKVKIICNVHGVFEQIIGTHNLGRGCRLCGIEYRSNLAKENPVGWSESGWVKTSKTSKDFDSFKVYIIKCWNDTEVFYKIGRTFLTTHIRFNSTARMPYKYEIIKEIIFDDAKLTILKESELKRLHKNFKYLPKIKFDGMHECFTSVFV